MIDIAGPIVGDEVDLTNAHWVIRPREMIARIGVEDVILLNDFEALALALTALCRRRTSCRSAASADRNGRQGGDRPGNRARRRRAGQGGGLVGAGARRRRSRRDRSVRAGRVRDLEAIELEHGRISAEVLLPGAASWGFTAPWRRAKGSGRNSATPADVTKAALAGSDAAGGAHHRSLCTRLLGRRRGRHGAGLHGARWRLYRRRHSAAHHAVPVARRVPPRLRERKRRTRT